MNSDNDNVIPFDKERHRQNRKRSREQQTNQKLNAAAGIARQLENLQGTLPREDRKILSENLGKICEDVFGTNLREMLEGLKKVFENVFGKDYWNYWKKRKRFVRFPGEVEDARGGTNGYGQYHARAREYERLARALGRVGEKLTEDQAILRLVRGSSFDTNDSRSMRARAAQADRIVQPMRKLLRKVKPELNHLMEAILERDAGLGVLYSEATGVDGFDIFYGSARPTVTLGEITQKIPPFLTIPLGLSCSDALDRIRRMAECTTTMERIDQYGTLSGEIEVADATPYMKLIGGWKRTLLELVAHSLDVHERDVPDNALITTIVEKVGQEKIWLYDLIQEARPSMLENGNDFGRWNADDLDRAFVAEYGSRKAAVTDLSKRNLQKASDNCITEENQPTVESVTETIRDILVKMDNFRQYRCKATEFDLEHQPCTIWVKHDLVLTPAIDRTTGDWTFCLGVPLAERPEYSVTAPPFDHLNPLDYIKKDDEIVEELPQQAMIFSALHFAFSVPIVLDDVAERRAAMGLGTDRDGQLYLAFYAIEDEDPDSLLPHLIEPWSGMPHHELPIFESSRGIDILFFSKADVVHGNYQNHLNGNSSAIYSPGLKPNSIAADILGDLASGNGEEGSFIYSNLKQSIEQKIWQIEQETAEVAGLYENHMSWLED